MFKRNQRKDYIGGAIINSSEGVFRLGVTDANKDWFALFQAFLEQPNVSQVRAISIGKTSSSVYPDTHSDVNGVIEALVACREQLSELEFLFLSDIDNLDNKYMPLEWEHDPDALSLATIFLAFNNLKYFGQFNLPFDFSGCESNSLQFLEIQNTFCLDYDYVEESDDDEHDDEDNSVAERIGFEYPEDFGDTTPFDNLSQANFPNLQALIYYAHPNPLNLAHLKRLQANGILRNLQEVSYLQKPSLFNEDARDYNHVRKFLRHEKNTDSQKFFRYFSERLQYDYE